MTAAVYCVLCADRKLSARWLSALSKRLSVLSLATQLASPGAGVNFEPESSAQTALPCCLSRLGLMSSPAYGGPQGWDWLQLVSVSPAPTTLQKCSKRGPNCSLENTSKSYWILEVGAPLM